MLENEAAQRDYSSLLEEATRPVRPNVSPGPEYASDKRYFQGIPAIERSPGGRLWAAWYSGGQGESCFNFIMLVSSGDDGDTWSDPVVIDPPGNVRACDDCLWLDPDGRLWLFWMQTYGLEDGQLGLWAMVTEESDKPHPAWSFPRRMVDGVMLNKPTVLSNGEWLFPISRVDRRTIANEKRMVPCCFRTNILQLMTEEQTRAVDQRAGAHVFVSTDKGKTITERGGVAAPQEVQSHNEHMLVERKDGSLLMFIRTSYGIGESVSHDMGRTWSPVVESGIPHPASRFFLRRLKSGCLLLVKNGLLKPEGDSGSPLKRDRLTAYLSYDDGLTWNGGLIIEERACSYPDGAQSPNGDIYIIYDHSRRKEKMILMARFTEADVLAGKFTSPRSRPRVLVNQATGVITDDISWERMRIEDGEKEKLIYTGI